MICSDRNACGCGQWLVPRPGSSDCRYASWKRLHRLQHPDQAHSSQPQAAVCPGWVEGWQAARDAAWERLCLAASLGSRPLCLRDDVYFAQGGVTSASLQGREREAVAQQAQLLAFDRQNHAGASDRLASHLRDAIAEEAEALLADKRVVAGAVNIADNRDKMKVAVACMLMCWLAAASPMFLPSSSSSAVDSPRHHALAVVSRLSRQRWRASTHAAAVVVFVACCSAVYRFRAVATLGQIQHLR